MYIVHGTLGGGNSLIHPDPHHALLRAARGQDPADIVFANADLFNPFTGEWALTNFAVKNGIVVGSGIYTGKRVIDLRGAPVIPGMIDAHTHVESSLLHPREYARLVVRHGTTTVIADPHEIANVCGVRGIEFILSLRDHLPIDLFLMLPSCVPATREDRGGSILEAADLKPFTGHPGILGLGEMMNVPGVLAGDSGVMQKIQMCHLVDGHAPFLRGNDLNAYILAGMQSDHECTSYEEAREKLAKGMYIFIREGSTERNLKALAPLISPLTVSRCAFATDDRQVDLLVRSGHIDDCVRKAIGYGVEPELAFRMATLSAASRFGLDDRGAISPGRIADFCVLAERSDCRVIKVFRRGMRVKPEERVVIPPFRCSFACSTPGVEQIAIRGGGNARVIGLIAGQIVTHALDYQMDPGQVPDLARDILKVVVVSRYQPGNIGIGLVHGFGFTSGAIAGSVSHDSHNIIAAGVADRDIIAALDAVIRSEGALTAVNDQEQTVLPLGCAGLMSLMPYEEVAEGLGRLQDQTAAMGAIPDPFMYLSFLALTVIPHLRITPGGPFDVDEFRLIPLFSERSSPGTWADEGRRA